MTDAIQKLQELVENFNNPHWMHHNREWVANHAERWVRDHAPALLEAIEQAEETEEALKKEAEAYSMYCTEVERENKELEQENETLRARIEELERKG